MIPCRLQIKNFLSYGNEIQSIDFTPHRLICLSGKNGHGKSALLDAITWAIWGQARKPFGSGKADESLLRLGQDSMFVTFDFLMNGIRYRIKREYTHSYGKPYSGLEFGILDVESNVFKPLTDKTIRSTQQKIEDTLRLDFDSFINSAFLRQGQSNEFSKKSAKERKDILGTILGLGTYELVRARALDKIRIANNEKNILNTLQESTAKDLVQEPQLNQELEQLTTTLREVEILLKEQATILVRVQSEKETILNKQKQYLRILFNIETIEQERARTIHILKQLIVTWRSVHKQSLVNTNTQDMYNKKAVLTKIIDDHQQAFHRLIELKEHALGIKTQIQELEKLHQHAYSQEVQRLTLAAEKVVHEEHNCLTFLTDTQKQLAIITQELKTQADTIHTWHEHKKANAHLNRFFETTQAQFIKRKSYYQKFIAQGNWLTTELRTLTQKYTVTKSHHNPACPLCEQQLSASQKNKLNTQFACQEALIQHKIGRLRTITEQLKKLLIEQHTHLEQLKKEHDLHVQQLVQLDEAYKKQAVLEKKSDEVSASVALYTRQLEQLSTKKQRALDTLRTFELQQKDAIKNDGNYEALLKKLATVEVAIQKTTYDSQATHKAQQELKDIVALIALHEQLHHEQVRQKQRLNDVSILITTLKKMNLDTHNLLHEKKAYDALQEELAALEPVQTAATGAQRELTQKKELLLEQKGTLHSKHAFILQQKEVSSANKNLLNILDTTLHDYQAIAAATSKDGIQALLIEDAIPEIEQEANALLSKLTNNQAQLFVESLRDLKKGGTKETLDIKISDAMGIRPYELFSGGEAFRIDFALRIAISKLLARRAGTALQTLIIDEGFGSQDEEGLSLIMDCLHRIQDDFHKIIIVSHLPSMKDQFPVQFLIEKSPNGSKVTIIEQD